MTFGNILSAFDAILRDRMVVRGDAGFRPTKTIRLGSINEGPLNLKDPR